VHHFGGPKYSLDSLNLSSEKVPQSPIASMNLLDNSITQQQIQQIQQIHKRIVVRRRSSQEIGYMVLQSKNYVYDIKED